MAMARRVAAPTAAAAAAAVAVAVAVAAAASCARGAAAAPAARADVFEVVTDGAAVVLQPLANAAAASGGSAAAGAAATACSRLPRRASAARDERRAAAGGKRFREVAAELGVDAWQRFTSVAPPQCPHAQTSFRDGKLARVEGVFCEGVLFSGGVATGDVDGDGVDDLVMTRYDDSPVLFRGTRDGGFEDASEGAGLVGVAGHTNGALLFDADNDGDLDLYITTVGSTSGHLFFVNDGAGHFTEVAEERGVMLATPYPNSGTNPTAADIDGDGFLDLLVPEWLPDFSRTPESPQVTAAMGGSRLLRNRGAEGDACGPARDQSCAGHFVDVTVSAGISLPPNINTDTEGYGKGNYDFQAVWLDQNDDDLIDMLMVSDFGGSRVWMNAGNGTFEDAGTPGGWMAYRPDAMGSALGDFTGNGRLDVFLSGIYDIDERKERSQLMHAFAMGNLLCIGERGGQNNFEADSRETARLGINHDFWAWGSAFVDHDNSGVLSLAVTNGMDVPGITEDDGLYLNRSAHFYVRETAEPTSPLADQGPGVGFAPRTEGRALLTWDFDDDGAIDMVHTGNKARMELYRNEGEAAGLEHGAWLRVSVKEPPARGGRDSLGARVRVQLVGDGEWRLGSIGPKEGYLANGMVDAHFGLGDVSTETPVHAVEVRWPATGNEMVLYNVSHSRTLVVTSPAGFEERVVIDFASQVDRCARATIEAITQPEAGGGSLVLEPSRRSIRYYPPALAPGTKATHNFTYVLGDGLGGTSEATVTLALSASEVASGGEAPTKGYAPFDGHGNNVANPTLGCPFAPMLRRAGYDYADGVDAAAGLNRPSARLVSNALCRQVGSMPGRARLNDLHTNFGQLLAHDLDFSTPFANAKVESNLPIDVPAGDPWFDSSAAGEKTLRFKRSGVVAGTGANFEIPREQFNKVTSFLDLSQVYGSDATRAGAQRERKGGRLLMASDGLLPLNTLGVPNANPLDRPREELFVSGDNRANVQPGLLVLHTLWHREHNANADELAAELVEGRAARGDARGATLTAEDDESLFLRARALTMAKWQAIVVYEYLPLLLGVRSLGPYGGYNASAHPGVSNEFATAAFRYGHSAVADVLLRLDERGEEHAAGHLLLRDAYFTPGRVRVEGGIEPLARGMLAQPAQEIDTRMVEGLRNFLFGTSRDGLDLCAVNIQRGRDHGLADFNSAREAYGLPRVRDFAEVTPDATVRAHLEALYESVDDVDLFVAGLAERHVRGGALGETFAAIIAEQFERTRAADRFWFENADTAPFPERIPELRATRICDILQRNAPGVRCPDGGSAFVLDADVGGDGGDGGGVEYGGAVVALVGAGSALGGAGVALLMTLAARRAAASRGGGRPYKHAAQANGGTL